MSEYFSLHRAPEIVPRILPGLGTTLLIVFSSILMGAILGLLFAWIRLSRIPVLSQLVALLVSFLRGTPVIILIFIVYYGVPLLMLNAFNVDVSSYSALYFVIIALGVNMSAFLSELFRGGFLSVPKGQYEAGYSVGLSRAQVLWRIVIPQMIRIVLPEFGVMSVNMFQNTAFAATLGIMDLMGRAQAIGSATNHSLESYFAVAILFVVCGLLLDFGFKLIDKKYALTI